MIDFKPQTSKTLVTSDYMKVIKYNDRTGNLVLSTCVNVNTETNETSVHYTVHSWTEAHVDLTKSFDQYSEAFDYYVELYLKYKKQ